MKIIYCTRKENNCQLFIIVKNNNYYYIAFVVDKIINYVNVNAKIIPFEPAIDFVKTAEEYTDFDDNLKEELMKIKTYDDLYNIKVFIVKNYLEKKGVDMPFDDCKRKCSQNKRIRRSAF